MVSLVFMIKTMNKNIIEVPSGIRYISDWEDFNKIFPKEPHIMDKTITGCGFTEWCLTNDMNVILCSPRNILLDNKAEQHPGEVYRIKSQFFDRELDVDKDTTTIKPRTAADYEEEAKEIERLKYVDIEAKSMYEKIDQELTEYFNQRPTLPKKILVTYDSFRILKSVLRDRGILKAFQVIVDEFQSIFTDARFKSSTELEFVGQLQDIERVCYLSATPMMENYLEDIEEFKRIPYYELDWKTLDPGRVMKPNLTVRIVKSIYEPAREIIAKYKEGDYEKFYKTDPETGEIKVIESKEAVFYMNSVWNIIQLILRAELKPSEVNILCAKTDKNEKQIKSKLGAQWKIGRVPTKDEPRKMFTLCTRTVYLGADFYSDNARSFVLSDANIDCLAVDISLDLPQILGRQRLWDNPWKNSAEFYYKPLTDKTKSKLDAKAFERKIKSKVERTNKKLRNWDLAEFKDVAFEDIMKIIQSDNYKDDYVGISNGKPTTNLLVLIAEKRAFDIQMIDYADRFSVINNMNMNTEGTEGEVNAFFFEYDNMVKVYDKLKFLCEANLSDEAREIVESRVDNKIRSYLSLGKDRLRALGYNTTKINKDLGVKTFNKEDLAERIYSEFQVGDRISKAEIKEKLSLIYEELEFKKKAKATDLEEWFEVKPTTFIENRIRLNGFELIRKL